jgi:hypothetical protein
MFELLYTSVAVTALNESELEALLGVSRRNNERDGLTGCLLHLYHEADGSAYFVQVLEGERDAVERTYDRIVADELHSDVRLLNTGPIGSRRYAGWHMRLAEMSLAELRAAVPAGSGPAPTDGLVRDPRAMSALLADLP